MRIPGSSDSHRAALAERVMSAPPIESFQASYHRPRPAAFYFR